MIQPIGTMEASDAASAIDMCWPLWRKDVAHTIAPIVVGTNKRPPMLPASQLWTLPSTTLNGMPDC